MFRVCPLPWSRIPDLHPIILPSTGPMSFPEGDTPVSGAMSLPRGTPILGGGTQFQAGGTPVAGGEYPSPRQVGTPVPSRGYPRTGVPLSHYRTGSTPAGQDGIHPPPLPRTGYVEGGTPLAVSHSRTVVIIPWLPQNYLAEFLVVPAEIHSVRLSVSLKTEINVTCNTIWLHQQDVWFCYTSKAWHNADSHSYLAPILSSTQLVTSKVKTWTSFVLCRANNSNCAHIDMTCDRWITFVSLYAGDNTGSVCVDRQDMVWLPTQSNLWKRWWHSQSPQFASLSQLED